MQLFYKIFLVLLVVCIGFSIYGIDWQLGFLHEENSKFLFSAAAGILGILVIFVMNMWSKLASKK